MFRHNHLAESGAAARRTGAWDWLAGAAFLTSMAVATIGWCCLLALAMWKAALWLAAEAPPA